MEIDKKEKENEELENFNFTFEDIMLRTDYISIGYIKDKYMINYIYYLWNSYSKEQKKEFIMTYIDNIQVYKYKDKIKLKKINYRKTFIEEFSRLIMNNAINGVQVVTDVSDDNKDKLIYTCLPQEKNQFRKYIEKLNSLTEMKYYEIPKSEIQNSGAYKLYYEHNPQDTLYKLVPLLNKKRMYKNITHCAIIEAPKEGNENE